MIVKGKNIFITGANRGIGKALALEAAKRKLFVHCICRKRIEELENEILNTGAVGVRTWCLDLSHPKEITEFIDRVKEQEVSVDILINNAGQLTGGLIENQPIEDIYQMFQVNLLGLIHLTHGLLPQMQELTEAKIVNNSSISGRLFFPCSSTYAASKAGVIAFTESIKQELRGTGVSTLLLLTPGVKTRMFNRIPDLYSKHLPMSSMSSISAQDWAQKVFNAIELDKDYCLPHGKTKMGLRFAHYFPNYFEKIVAKRFQR